MWQKKVWMRILKISGISVGSLLLLLLILPYLFPKTISNKIKGLINQSITSKADFSSGRFSFFTHFPALTFTMKDVSVTGSAPFAKDTLVKAKEVALGVNLFSLFSKTIRIDQVFLTDANINVEVDPHGNANYNIYKSSGPSTDTSTSDAGLQLESIVVENSNLSYNDLSVPVLITAKKLNYSGKGDLSKAVFDLTSRLSVQSFSLAYDGETYINQKKIKAKLITKINTRSLSLVFENNLLRINQLPLEFSGHFDIVQHGYKMDLHLDSRKATLDDMVSAIPADLADWLDKAKVKGDADFLVRLKGDYDNKSNEMPDLQFGLKVKDGFIAYQDAPFPLKDLMLDMNGNLRSMNTDSLDLRIDTLFFKLDKGFCSLKSHSVGLMQPFMEAVFKADLNLEHWDKALGMNGVDLKGQFRMDFNARGRFTRGQNPESWRKNIVITSIPLYQLTSSVHNGYFKLTSLPEGVRDINFNIISNCTDGNYRHVSLKADDLNFRIMGNLLKGFVRVADPERPEVDANLSGKIRLQDIARAIPMKDLILGGDLAIDIKTSGIYDEQQKAFPITDGTIKIVNGEIKTGYYPQPISNIQLLAAIHNSDGKLSGTTVQIQPVSFEFEGLPFTLKADVSNPDNLRYDIVSDGSVNIGKLYQVFAIKGYDASGFVKADVKLKGKQSDAIAGRYQLLDNSGQLILKDIRLYSESFPKPLTIQSGVFRFNQDKMWFDKFESLYGTAKFILNGYLENVIGYVLQDNAVLRGKLSLTTDRINLNEFTAFESPSDDVTRAGTDSSGAGVILVPGNLSLLFNANAGLIDFDSVAIKDFHGQMWVDSGKVKLKNTNFRIADAKFNMDATYEDVSPHKAYFDFKVKADSFSVAKAYQDIPMFREMATSAKGVQGIVGLDYTLSGRLNQNMQPVFPSLSGGGVINLKKVKLKGFRLMSAVSRSTEHKELDNPDLSGINLKTTIKNNIITIKRVKMRIAGFRPRFEGQVSMDGELNIKGRLGLPPFGIFGIPFMVSGTSEHPEVKLKRDKTGKVLQEKEDVEEDELVPDSTHVVKLVLVPKQN